MSEPYSIPVVVTLQGVEDFFNEIFLATKYQRWRQLYAKDAELFAAVHRLATCCYDAFQGFRIDKESGELTEIERKVLNEANSFARKFSLKRRMFSDATDLAIYGDKLYTYGFESAKGVFALNDVPIFNTIVVENKEQIETVETAYVIRDAKFYVTNPDGKSDEERGIIPVGKILHIDLNKSNQLVQDVRMRWTYGIWSIPPTQSLELMLLWKWNTIRNDMLWRHRNLPRQQHKLDLTTFAPDKYPGTFPEQIAAAKQAAKQHMEDYAKTIIQPSDKPLEADQGYVTDKNTEIVVIEPSKGAYTAADPVVDRANQAIALATGISQTFTGAGERTFAGVYITSEFMMKEAVRITDQISSKYLELVKKHLTEKFRNYPNEINSLDVRIRVFLEKDLAERIRQAAIMREMSSFTTTEIRETVGYDPLTKEQEAQLPLPLIRRSETLREITTDELKRRSAPSETSPLPKYPGEGEPK